MALLISLVTTSLSLVMTIKVSRQAAQRRKPHQVVWALAFALFGIGVACQFLSQLNGWSSPLYRLWYLTGAVLAAAYLGQGTVYLLVRRRLAHAGMLLLAIGSAVLAIGVFTEPVSVHSAVAGDSISGTGMPLWIRQLTPLFNIYGTVALVGGAGVTIGRFLWNGGSARRAAGPGLIGLGAIAVALGGTLARYGYSQSLYISELIGMVLILWGFLLTEKPAIPVHLSANRLRRRRTVVTRFGVSFGATMLLASVAILPVLPWPMGIVTDAQHVYMESVPDENKGVYLNTDRGVMQLFTWGIQPSAMPSDAPTLPNGSIREIVVVQKQFADAADYWLYDLTTNEHVVWQDWEKEGTHLALDPGLLPAGDYMLKRPTDNMFGGSTWHYFRVD